MDFNIVDKFVSIAKAGYYSDDARVSLALNNDGKAQDVRTTETNVFSRLAERMFRSDADSAINRAARQELVDTLTGLFKVADADHLPPNVRDAFVKGEIVCDRPLTKRRVTAVLTAAVRELGFKDMAEFEKRVKMKNYLDRKLEENPDKNLFSDDLDCLKDWFKGMVERSSDFFVVNGFTQADLEAYFDNWASNVYAVSADRERQLTEAARRQAPEQVKLEGVLGNRKEAEDILNTAHRLVDTLNLQISSRSRNDLYIQIRKAVQNALDCVEMGNPKDSAVKKAAKFLRGLRFDRSLHELVSSVKVDGISDSYLKMMEDATKNINTFIRNEMNKARNQATDKSVAESLVNRLKIAHVNMSALLMALDPMGDDFLDLSNNLNGKVESLYNCAQRITNAVLAEVDEKTTLEDITNKLDAPNRGNEGANLDDYESDVLV